MAFATERELQLTLKNLKLYFMEQCASVIVRREVPVGGSVPDLIYVCFASRPLFLSSHPRLSYRHTFVIWLLRQHKCLNSAEIADRTFESLSRINPIIDDLVRSGVVNKKSSGSYTLSETFASTKAEVIAAETKLRRWRKALEQAISYQAFADRVFVAMDNAWIRRGPDVLDEFEKAGIGLCIVARDSVEWLVLPPATGPTRGAEREHLIVNARSPLYQSLTSLQEA